MFVLTILALVAAPAAEVIPAGTQLNYRGRFVAEAGDAAATEKQFELAYIVAKEDGGTVSADWTSEERGRGGWSWPDRFGKWELSDQLRPQGGVGPALSYERPDGVSVIVLQLPFLTYTEPFAVGTTWFEGTLEYRVAAEEKAGAIETWRIDVRGPVGRKRTIWVEKTSPLVVAMLETVFLGQGEQHDLQWELVSRNTAEVQQSSNIQSAFDEILKFRARLEIEPRQREVRWSAERLALLKADLPSVTEKARGTPLEKLAQAAELDSKNQRERANALGALHGKLVGRAAPQPRLETTAGEEFAWPDVKGKVAVLHFWDYRDTPLEEPYGQVAYLDFLARQHMDGDVKVFGVVADERVTQPDSKRTGVQSAKKLHSFMNLSYPLLVDEGAAIKDFGDPRVTGAKLPLFVVIDRQGRIVHYHAGHYEVSRDRGLEELGKVITQSLIKQD